MCRQKISKEPSAIFGNHEEQVVRCQDAPEYDNKGREEIQEIEEQVINEDFENEKKSISDDGTVSLSQYEEQKCPDKYELSEPSSQDQSYVEELSSSVSKRIFWFVFSSNI